MRAIHILIILLILILSGCTSVKVAKVFTKTTSSIKASVEKISDKRRKIIEKDNLILEDDLTQEKEKIITEQKKEKAVAVKQKRNITIEFLGKTLPELIKEFGEPALIRLDSGTKTVRFDTSSCRLFVFFNLKIKKSGVNYYEIRNTKGNLIDRKTYIEKCFKDIKKV